MFKIDSDEGETGDQTNLDYDEEEILIDQAAGAVDYDDEEVLSDYEAAQKRKTKKRKFEVDLEVSRQRS